MADADGVLFVTCMPLDAAGLVSNRSPYRPPSSSDIYVVLVVCILISAFQSSCIASFAQFCCSAITLAGGLLIKIRQIGCCLVFGG
jgi:hypothetical protein